MKSKEEEEYAKICRVRLMTVDFITFQSLVHFVYAIMGIPSGAKLSFVGCRRYLNKQPAYSLFGSVSCADNCLAGDERNE